MNGKFIKIDNTNRDKYIEDFLNIKLRKEDIIEIEKFGIEVDKVILEVILKDTQELYIYKDENNITQAIFGMKIEDSIGRPFIIQSENFNIKNNIKWVMLFCKYFLKEWKQLVNHLEVYKPTSIINTKLDKFLEKLNFNIETDGVYKIGDNHFIKYKN